mmetsp:Transcript_9409/g.23833  ORF Transcript_9409/g.23833 Transcript_9409/m.23833 type:complete len:132 (-) Transcript_9409:223-618(-)
MVRVCFGRLCYLREALQFPPELCDRQFLILDPRVNRLHNQIISSELGIFLARAWGRVLLLPGFFSLPSTDPDSGEWARVGSLFDLEHLRRCHEVYELQEALQVGHGVGWRKSWMVRFAERMLLLEIWACGL